MDLNFIQTQDQEKANRVARKLRSGMVDINGAGIGTRCSIWRL